MIMDILFKMIAKIPILFVTLYGLTFFFSNFGPNSTTFIIPSEIYPSDVKSTCYGISAMMGKLGAILGGILIKPIFDHFGLQICLILCAFVSFTGMLLTFFFTKDDNIKGNTIFKRYNFYI